MQRRKRLLIISGAIVLVLVLIAVGIFAMNSGVNANSATSTSTPTVAPQPTSKPTGPYVQALKQYGSGIKSQMAQGLKLTTDQLATQLQVGKSLSDIATAQGLSAAQLQNLIATSLQNGLNPAISSGELTQKQVTLLIKRWQKNPKTLEHLLGARLKKAAIPTPGIGATPTP
jgi:flagellar basal body-associated protein FliL